MGKQNECNLDCTDHTQGQEAAPNYLQVMEFDGPVRVVIVDPPDEKDTKKKVVAAGFISLASMMIAGSFMIVILFTLSCNFARVVNYHILLCSIGSQMCIPLSILMVHPLFGPARPLDVLQRVKEHEKLCIASILCLLSGVYCSYRHVHQNSKYFPFWRKLFGIKLGQYHELTGYAALGCLGVCVFSAYVIRLFKSKSPYLRKGHRYSGILTLLLMDACILFGVMLPQVQILMYAHAYLTPTIAVFFFTTVYTVLVIIFPSWHYPEE